MAVMACGLGLCERRRGAYWLKGNVRNRKGGLRKKKGLHLHSRCFFLGAITS